MGVHAPFHCTQQRGCHGRCCAAQCDVHDFEQPLWVTPTTLPCLGSLHTGESYQGLHLPSTPPSTGCIRSVLIDPFCAFKHPPCGSLSDCFKMKPSQFHLSCTFGNSTSQASTTTASSPTGAALPASTCAPGSCWTSSQRSLMSGSCRGSLGWCNS